MNELGRISALGQPPDKPLLPSWMGREDAPPPAPSWAIVGNLSSTQLQGLLAQIGYDLSDWDYSKIGENNLLGRYQFSSQILEAYGLLASGSISAYGLNCINYRHCWNPIYSITNRSKSYQNYFYNTKSLRSFLNTPPAQDFLAYQRLVDLYLDALTTGTILETDTPETVAGMMYVCWTLGVGAGNTDSYYTGDGAYAWRYYNLGNGAPSYASGRYAATNLGG